MIKSKTDTELVYKHKMSPSEKIDALVGRIIIYVGIFIVVFPILWILGASLSEGSGFFSGRIFPDHISFANYKKLFSGDDIKFGTALMNSLIVCTGVSIIQLFMTATSAYAFSRMKFLGRKYGIMALMILQVFPAVMSISAYYIILYKYSLIGNIFALILILSAGSAFNVWLLKNYIDGLPRELDEAAKVDGATEWQVFWKIVMPLCKPMLAVMFFLCFQGIYNEFPLSSVVLNDPENRTVAVALQSLLNNRFSQNWTEFSAGALIASLPLMIVFMSLQKFIEKGMVAGGVKE